MPLFKRKTNVQQKDSGDFSNLTESAYTNSISDIKGIALYNFINALKGTGNGEFFYGNTYERMMDDAIISSAIDLYIDDATQVDPTRNKMVWVEVDVPEKDGIEDKLSKGLTEELNNFLSEIEIEKNLPLYARQVMVHGDVPIKVSFVDKLEDERLVVNRLTESSIDSMMSEIKDDISNIKQVIPDDKPILIESYINSRKDDSRIINRYNKKVLKESYLKEDALISYKEVLTGRWYTEIIGKPGSLCALESKGKIIALLDRDDTNNVITKDNVAFFMNPKATRVTLEVGNYLDSADKREYYTISHGESFLKNARIAWQVLSALEDILLLTRMTRSILYRIFSVEVANKGNKETMQILNSLKNKIKMDETIDVKEKIYNSTLAQVPLADSIFIPTRNGIGAIKVDTVGGDFNLRDAIDLDYFKDKLFAALKIPRSFLGFEDDMPGSLGNTSLVRMDIRYARSVRGLQNILVQGIKDIIDIYLKYTRTEKVLRELPNIRVCMTSINTSEDMERIESEKIKMETVDKIVETLNNLGIDLSQYTNVRDKIINQYFGSEIVSAIKKDSDAIPKEPIPDKEDDEDKPSFSSTPSDVSYTGDSDNNIGSGSPDELIGGEDAVNISEPNSSEDASNEPPQDIPYSLK